MDYRWSLDLEETPSKNLSMLIFRADPTANPKAVLTDMVELGSRKAGWIRHFRAVTPIDAFLPDITDSTGAWSISVGRLQTWRTR